LAKQQYKVTVIAKEFSPNITSNVAGALWEWPPAVCGYHSDEVSLERSKDWCMQSYEIFYELAKHEEAGVFIKDVFFFFRQMVADNSFHSEKMTELKEKVKGFRHDPKMIKEEGVNQNIGLIDAYKHEAPMVDTDLYMPWLMKQVKQLGVNVIPYEVSGRLTEIRNDLCKQFDSEYIINCSGLGAAELANEYMYPLRGALVRVKNTGDTFPVLDKAYCVSFDEKTREQDIVFIVPRGKNMIVLGALAEEEEYDMAVNLENYQPIRDMYGRCKEFLPQLEHAELDLSEPVRIGLRPFRRGNVRLEFDIENKIIHNYGHGGAGVTFSWGCAKEIVEMIASNNPEKSNRNSKSIAYNK
ncbi:MAG: D-amino-acid oxidase, partial [Dokdonia sp.]